MNIYCKDYNIYTSRTNNVVPVDYESRYDLLDCVWSALCQTLNNCNTWL